jgi:hypothetical protein
LHQKPDSKFVNFVLDFGVHDTSGIYDLKDTANGRIIRVDLRDGGKIEYKSLFVSDVGR